MSLPPERLTELRRLAVAASKATFHVCGDDNEMCPFGDTNQAECPGNEVFAVQLHVKDAPLTHDDIWGEVWDDPGVLAFYKACDPSTIAALLDEVEGLRLEVPHRFASDGDVGEPVCTYCGSSDWLSPGHARFGSKSEVEGLREQNDGLYEAVKMGGVEQERLRDALRNFEWRRHVRVVEGETGPAEVDGDLYCPSCGGWESAGHKETCWFVAALAPSASVSEPTSHVATHANTNDGRPASWGAEPTEGPQ